MIQKLRVATRKAIPLTGAFFLVFVSQSAGVQQGCPAVCGSSFFMIGSSGELPECAVFIVQSLDSEPGWGIKISDPENPGQTACLPCESCENKILFTFNTQSCGDDYAVAYNNCGSLVEGPNGGGIRSTFYEACGDWLDFSFEIGVPNPDYDPANCPPDTPILGESTYLEDWRFWCIDCN